MYQQNKSMEPEIIVTTDANPFEKEEEEKESVPAQMTNNSELSLYYNMSGEKYLIIINHETYRKSLWRATPSSRCGTKYDATRLEQVFGSLGFKVLLQEDPTHDQIIDYFMEVTQRCHKETSCIIVALMTHGDGAGVVHAADRPYKLDDIFKLFRNGHPTLINKPKIFFIQACRGGNMDEGRVVSDGERSAALLPTHMDFAILYSTVEDFVSWREPDSGSWLIQELCDSIEEFSNTLDLLHIITLTNLRVAYGREARTRIRDVRFKQIPETSFTLTKLLKFQ